MRELSFRGKRLDNGEWVDGGSIFKLINKSGEHFFIPRFNEKVIATHDDNMNIIALEGCILYKVDPETVGEYTGLRDCKRTAEYPEGQMIFEGDVIKVERDLHCGENKKEREIFNGVVWYDDKHTCFGIKSKKYRCLPIHRFKGDYSAIIGNIHDNPEILKEGGEK